MNTAVHLWLNSLRDHWAATAYDLTAYHSANTSAAAEATTVSLEVRLPTSAGLAAALWETGFVSEASWGEMHSTSVHGVSV